MQRRIEAARPRRLMAISVAYEPSRLADFGSQRKSIHNLISHQRGRSTWWGTVGLWLWRGEDGLKGVVELGSVTQDEMATALRRHGAVTLRHIDTVGVRVEIYRAALSPHHLPVGPRSRRYQAVSIAISPVIVKPRAVQIKDARIVNGGAKPGQCGGVKAGHWRQALADMARAPIGALAIPLPVLIRR
jgi:hypothetical protein